MVRSMLHSGMQKPSGARPILYWKLAQKWQTCTSNDEQRNFLCILRVGVECVAQWCSIFFGFKDFQQQKNTILLHLYYPWQKGTWSQKIQSKLWCSWALVPSHLPWVTAIICTTSHRILSLPRLWFNHCNCLGLEPQDVDMLMPLLRHVAFSLAAEATVFAPFVAAEMRFKRGQKKCSLQNDPNDLAWEVLGCWSWLEQKQGPADLSWYTTRYRMYADICAIS